MGCPGIHGPGRPKAKEEEEDEDEAEDEEGESESDWQTPSYADLHVEGTSHRKEYARVVVPPAMLEAGATETVESTESTAVAETTGTFVPRMIASGSRGRIQYKTWTPRRYRPGDRLFPRPRWNRFDPYSPRHPNGARVAAMKVYEQATHISYDRLEAYCSTRLPEAYGKFCRPILRHYRVISEGLRYGDRPEQVCMNIQMCPKQTYVRDQPHQLEVRW